MFLIIIFIQLLVILLGYLYISSKRFNYPPGPGHNPFVGSLPYVTFQEWAKTYGPIIYANFGFHNTVIIDDPKLLRKAFNDPIFAGREMTQNLTITTAGHPGIILMDPPGAFELRRATLRSMRSFGLGRMKVEKFILDEVKELVEWIQGNEGQPINIYERICIASTNPIMLLLGRCRFAHDDVTIRKTIADTNNAAMQLSQSSTMFTIPSILYKVLPKQFFREYHEACNTTAPFRQIISDVMKSSNHESRNSATNDVIAGLLATIKETTDSNTQLYAVDTIAAIIAQLYGSAKTMLPMLLSWMILLLVRFEGVQKKLQQELDEVIGNKYPSLADKIRLPYVQAVMTEILRYSSVSPLALFHKTLVDTRLGGYDIRKGTQVIGNFYSVHHSVQLWGDPENFRPERFLTPDGKNIMKTNNVMAFGTGKRSCLGESLTRDIFFIFLTLICHRFTLLPDLMNSLPPLESRDIRFFRVPKEFNVVFHCRCI